MKPREYFQILQFISILFSAINVLYTNSTDTNRTSTNSSDVSVAPNPTRNDSSTETPMVVWRATIYMLMHGDWINYSQDCIELFSLLLATSLYLPKTKVNENKTTQEPRGLLDLLEKRKSADFFDWNGIVQE